MHFPKLTPLQSRLVACLITTALLVIIYFTLDPTNFAYAAEVPLEASLHGDHNHHRIASLSDALAPDPGWEERIGGLPVERNLEQGGWDGETAGYQAEFFGVDRSIIGRALEGQMALQESVPSGLNVQAGETHYYVFENSSVWAPLIIGEGSGGILKNVTGQSSRLIRRLLQITAQEPEKSLVGSDYGAGAGWSDNNLNGSAEMGPLKRQAFIQTRTVFITVNTCLQPQPNNSDTVGMPQLMLYVSTTDDNPKPGPDSNGDQMRVALVEGYGNATVTATGNVYIGVSAPLLGDAFPNPTWNYEVSASINQPNFYFNDSSTFLGLIDSDSGSGLLVTGNLTDLNATEALKQAWMNQTAPFSLFVFDQFDKRLEGVRSSYCGLQKLQMGNITVNGTMTRRGFDEIPKEQFYVQGLRPGSSYTAMLAYSGQNLSQVWASKDFQTKSGGNCKLVYDLPFCDNVAWSVPWNGTLSMSELATQYDTYASMLFENFTASLDQVACNTTSTSRYSLVRGCADCSRDYKNWLCAVTIPRCADLSDASPWLTPRRISSPFANGTAPDLGSAASAPPGLNASMANATQFNSSRSAFVDQVVVPQPYRELLPCRELCFELVKSCPASLGFACPRQDWLMRRSYGVLDAQKGAVTCNYPGVDVPVVTGAGVRRGPARAAGLSAVAVMVVLALA